MAKVKKIEDEQTVTRLTKEEYWEWRFLISQMWNAENKELARKYQLESLNKEAIICSLKAQVFAAKDIENAKQEKEAMQKAYKDYKIKLENQLGISLNGVTIDDNTLEVKPLNL